MQDHELAQMMYTQMQEGTPDVVDVANLMTTQGGSFARAIGAALPLADSGNLWRLVYALPKLIHPYFEAARRGVR